MRGEERQQTKPFSYASPKQRNPAQASDPGHSASGEPQTAQRERERIAMLEAKLAKKDAVIAEVSEEYLAGAVRGTSGGGSIAVEP